MGLGKRSVSLIAAVVVLAAFATFYTQDLVPLVVTFGVLSILAILYLGKLISVSASTQQRRALGGVALLIGLLSAIYGINRINSTSSQVATLLGLSDTVAIGSIALGVSFGVVGVVMLVIGTPKIAK